MNYTKVIQIPFAMPSYALKLGNERDLLNFGYKDSFTLWGLSLKPGTCMGGTRRKTSEWKKLQSQFCYDFYFVGKTEDEALKPIKEVLFIDKLQKPPCPTVCAEHRNLSNCQSE